MILKVLFKEVPFILLSVVLKRGFIVKDLLCVLAFMTLERCQLERVLYFFISAKHD